jgi:GR25 family glycosyltransferase involved in LPS biosynthesis
LASHIKAIKTAKEAKAKHVLILEDDVEFPKDFLSKAEKVLSTLPTDWDAVWLGGYTAKEGEYYNEFLKTCVGNWGGYCYILRNTVFDKFIEQLERRDQPCDVTYTEIQRFYNCFRTIKNLILHKDTVSTITLKMTNYDRLSRE